MGTSESGAGERGREHGRTTDADVVVVCGPPGVGKTTVAEVVAEELPGDVTLLRTDVVRKELFPDPEYTAEETRRTYEELTARAGDALDAGGPVVLDGTFRRRADRRKVADLAAECDATLRLVRVACEEARVRARIEAREGDESDADFEVHRLIKDSFEPLAHDHVVVDNSGAVEETRRQVRDCLGG